MVCYKGTALYKPHPFQSNKPMGSSINKFTLSTLSKGPVQQTFWAWKYVHPPPPPPTDGRSRRHPHSFFCLGYLLNQWMDFDQTCIETLVGGWNELVRFSDLDLIVKVTAALCEMSEICFLCIIFDSADGFWPNLHRYIVGRRGKVDPNQRLNFNQTCIDILLGEG